MIDPSAVLVTTTEEVPGFDIAAMLGEVFGSTSRSSHGSVVALGASLNPVSQGELVHFTKLIEEGKDEAIARLKEAAALKGANAVVAMRFNIDSISELGLCTVAYGTAAYCLKIKST